MLQLWLCTDRKRNTARMLDEVAGLAAQEQGGLLLLVPEQFSHMMERRLCADADRPGRTSACHVACGAAGAGQTENLRDLRP